MLRHLATARSASTILLFLVLFSMPAFGATLTVTNTNDTGAGSLREAMTNAKSGDRIEFAIPGSGPHVIQPLTSLPAVTGVVIDGRTQPGYAGTPRVTIDGSLGADGGLTLIRATVQALAVTRMRYGIVTSRAIILDCHIGVDATGTIARGNQIGVYGSGGTIRGNLISGNTERGVSIYGFGDGGDVLIEQNRFGTDVTGTTLLGATTIQAYMFYTGTWTFTFRNNVVGGGVGVGVQVDNGEKVTISRNHIGVSRSGTPIRNRTGVQISGSRGVVVSDNVIADNTIGIQVLSGLRNRLLDNVMTRNGFGISLKNEWSPRPTMNDVTDDDIGANNLLNYPVITRATSLDGTTKIDGTLHSHPNRTFTIELFVSPSCNSSGYGEGFKRLHVFDVTTDGAGNATFTHTLDRSLPAGQVITATSTSALEGTSEFSRCAIVEGRGRFAFSGTTVFVYEWQSDLNVVVKREAGAIGPATVTYATAPGTASTSDYVSASGTLQFADGETQKTITLKIVDDNIDEDTQSFTLSLKSATGATLGEPKVLTVQIHDNEHSPYVQVNAPSKPEGNSGTTPFPFEVRLSHPSETPLTFAYRTNNSSANTEDYVPISGSITFTPGEVLKTVTVMVNGDRTFESSESFYLYVSGNWTSNSGYATILNDDAGPIVTVADVAVRETDSGTTAVLTLTANMPVSGELYWTTRAGTATPADFIPRSGYISFSSETTKTISIPIIGDDLPEADEHFTVSFYRYWGSFVSTPPPATVTIEDDDIGVGPERLDLQEGDSGKGVIHVGAPAASDTVFLLESSAPEFVRVPQSVTLPAGSTRVQFEIHGVKSGAANVTVHIPTEFRGGSSRIRVTTYRATLLTLQPSDLTLLVGETVTVRATLTPANTEPVRVSLTSTDTVSTPAELEIPAGGEGSFEVRALKEGAIVITATLGAAFGREVDTIGGRVIAQPTAPTILGVSPPDGSTAGGTVVDIRGALFREQCTVSFGGAPAAVTFVDTHNLRAIAPPHALGVVDVVVTCGSDVATLTNAFTYRDAGAHMRAVTPSSGSISGGTHLVISGVDFASSCWPFFDDVPAPSAVVRDPNTITATTPPHAAGTSNVRLLCTGTSTMLPQAFTFVAAADPAPQIENVDPLFGAPGDVVTITGTGFRPNSVVLFGDVAAQVLDVTPDTLIAVVPDLAPGTVSITISAGTVVATTGPIFTVGEASPPRVAKVTASAAAGAEIVLEGTNFRPSYTFAIRGKRLELVSLEPTRAVVRLPADLAAGTYAIEIVNAAGRVAAMAPAVSVRDTGVVVTRVAANCIDTEGGVDVVIEGSGFAAGAAVTFDGIPATDVVVLDPTKITARVPRNYAGDATIAVINADGTSSTLTGAFRYVSPFDPRGCTPSSGRTRAVRH